MQFRAQGLKLITHINQIQVADFLFTIHKHQTPAPVYSLDNISLFSSNLGLHFFHLLRPGHL